MIKQEDKAQEVNFQCPEALKFKLNFQDKRTSEERIVDQQRYTNLARIKMLIKVFKILLNKNYFIKSV